MVLSRSHQISNNKMQSSKEHQHSNIRHGKCQRPKIKVQMKDKIQMAKENFAAQAPSAADFLLQ